MRARFPWRGLRGLMVAGGLGLGSLVWSATDLEIRGQPFVRTYPLDEIGSVPRGLRLGFDSFGRIAVMYDGIYSVLNDTGWVDRIDPDSETKIRMTVIKVVDGRYYYGGRGSWGVVTQSTDGRFRAEPLVPPDAPAWTSVTPFNSLLSTRTGVFFYEFNGVVYWDFARRRNSFFELPRVASVFRVGERVFVSCEDRRLREILPESGAIRPVEGAALAGAVVRFAIPLDATHALLALQDERLVVFDGRTADPWEPQAAHRLTGPIAALEKLVDGGVAVAITGRGVFLVAADGRLLWSLVSPEFGSIAAMAAGEAGVLWAAGENAVHKIFYASPLTSFGQQLGLTVFWPMIAAWGDRVVVCSRRTLSELKPPVEGSSFRFDPLPSTPPGGADLIATSGDLLLVGNATGVFAAGADAHFTPVIALDNVEGLEFVDPDTCVVIGSREVAIVRHAQGAWRECAPRIPGVGDVTVRTVRHHGAVWLELGGDRIARVALRAGAIELQRIAPPWHGAQWTNVGVVGRLIVLSGSTGQRAYYDDQRGAFTPAPQLDELLGRSPYWISRITEDASGTLWATHAQGVVTFTPNGRGYEVDSETFELRNDSYPSVHLLPGRGVWIACGRSLHHVERSPTRPAATPRPQLVSLVADEQRREFLRETGAAALPRQFAVDDNSLSFRFFSGTYAWRYPPVYEYRLDPAEPWTKVDANLLLHFPKLRDGSYHLEVRLAGPDRPVGAAFALPFVINPPWYRTPGSYAAGLACLLALVFAIVRWTNRQSLKRNEALQRLVHERTGQLEAAMEKLNEETRNAATMAERSRLAGEIHDSLQQGLSGSILQLDTTLTTAPVSPEVRARLKVVRNMLSYTREEIQHSVWNLESPLLQDSNLCDALATLATFINSGSIEMKVTVPPDPVSLEPVVQHHLLRIAQEAITNAVKHANASRIAVTLLAQSAAIQLIITDDGAGFDLAVRSHAEGHFGLRGLRNRARAIKAELLVQTSPGHGTTVQVTVPLAPHKNDRHRQAQPP